MSENRKMTIRQYNKLRHFLINETKQQNKTDKHIKLV